MRVETAAAPGPMPPPRWLDRSVGHRAAIDWVMFLAFATWNTWRVFGHVAWRDELQAFLIARESTGPLSLFHNLAHEAHPGLWHLLLMAAIRLWDDPAVLRAIQAAVAVAIAYLIWIRSPFTRLEKAFLSLSYYLALEYAVLARGYGLGVVLFFGFVMLRRSPWAWIMLGLMANISIHFLALAGVCAGLLLHRGQRSLWGIAGCALLFVIAAAVIFPAPGTIAPVAQPGLAIAIPAAVMHLSAALLPFNLHASAHYYWDNRCYDCGGWGMLLIGLAVPGLGAASLWRRKDLAVAFLFVSAALLAIGALAYVGADRHYGVAFIMLVGLHWIAREEGYRRRWIFDGWITLSAIVGLWSVFWSLVSDFSGGRTVASWIERNGPPNAVLAAYPGWMGTDISAYLGVPTYNLQTGHYQTYIVWNYVADERANIEKLTSWLRSAPKTGPLYLITDPAPGYIGLYMDLALMKRGIRLEPVISVDRAIFRLRLYRVLFDPMPTFTAPHADRTPSQSRSP